MTKSISITINNLSETEAVETLNKIISAPIAKTDNVTIHSIKDVETPTAAPIANPIKPTHPTPAMIAAEAAKNAEPVTTPAEEEKPKVVPKGAGVDAMGVPWDERIHAGTKTKTAKNIWKKKKGLDDAEYDAVIAELKAATPAEEVPVTTPVAPPAPAKAQPAAAPAPVLRDFATLINHVSELTNSERASMTYPQTIVDRINTGFGSQVATLADIASNAEMVAYAWSCLEVDELI